MKRISKSLLFGFMISGLASQVFAADLKSDFKKILTQAEKGNAEAQFYLATAYDNGKGTTRDYVKAAKWYQKAAEKGIAEAQFNLGHMYHTGQGVAKDDKQAVKWWLKSAEQGYVAAQYNLANMYQKGWGVEKNYEEATKWFNAVKEAKSKLEKIKAEGAK